MQIKADMIIIADRYVVDNDQNFSIASLSFRRVDSEYQQERKYSSLLLSDACMAESTGATRVSFIMTNARGGCSLISGIFSIDSRSRA